MASGDGSSPSAAFANGRSQPSITDHATRSVVPSAQQSARNHVTRRAARLSFWISSDPDRRSIAMLPAPDEQTFVRINRGAGRSTTSLTRARRSAAARRGRVLCARRGARTRRRSGRRRGPSCARAARAANARGSHGRRAMRQGRRQARRMEVGARELCVREAVASCVGVERVGRGGDRSRGGRGHGACPGRWCPRGRVGPGRLETRRTSLVSHRIALRSRRRGR